MNVEPYLSFPGTCEEALAFYRSIFGGEIGDIMRFGDAPSHGQGPPPAPNAVMHTSFRAPGLAFMASDAMHDQLAQTGESARVRLSIATADVAEGQRLFTALAAEGAISVPFTKQFWGATFGMLTDRFGIDWMVNAG